ncbi:phage tail protein [Magnetospirillum fulvum]|uniref:UDP-N-acetylmuramate:L-alanyl-gamma-D-glutamyl-meso-diaminopimelate ligase n=1 Tax=Magnetospirillum fulvum MGU-K5 TaxID=1316936 RepID=S9S7V5_MAGFU|nr:tail fiber protein [Magnetospirillum fulvum]EPY01977.1 UDP-N-acetylmuramate:L-alanyl-gamma-D-glutamyl-meso-diaminopimelate ligase [Magnetospirillum fulvum MGU-K5]
MGDWFLGEIRLFSMSWNPQDWLLCDGSILQISGNQALYSLLGTTYGGDGKNTFALPDLRGRTIVGTSMSDATYQRGKAGGSETVPLTQAQIPQHQHDFMAAASAGTVTAIGAGVTIATVSPTTPVPQAPAIFTNQVSSPKTKLNSGTIGVTGSADGHPNMQPSLVLNYCIARSGIYPPRN